MTDQNGSESECSLLERFTVSPDLARYQLGDNREFLYSFMARRGSTVLAQDYSMVQACTAFASLDEHAAQLRKKFFLEPEIIRQRLNALVEHGLLVSESELTDMALRSVAESRSFAKISSLGIPTRDRAQTLHRCVLSYAASIKEYEREIEIVVVDGSDAIAMQQANRDALADAERNYGVRCVYFGVEERSDLIAQLAKSFPPDVVEFALGNPENCPVQIGCNRNVLLLGTAGDVALQVDDDTTCKVIPAPSSTDALCLTSKYDCEDFWFPGADAKLPDSHSCEKDFFSLHERLLGKSVADCIRQSENMKWEGIGAQFFRRLQVGGNVSVTALGLLGDSAIGISPIYLQLKNDSRERLLASEDTFRETLNNGNVYRSVSQVTIGDNLGCIAANLGLDNRRLLPPFMPVQRNEDGAFGALLRASGAGDFFGFLPWVIEHDRPGTREIEDLTTLAGRIGSGDVVIALISSFKALNDPDGAKNLCALGRLLVEQGSMPLGDFEEFVRICFGRLSSVRIKQLEAQLKEYSARPEFWSLAVKNYMTALQAAVVKNDYVVPHDLVVSFGVEEARRVMQRLVLRLGRLLQCWPEMRTMSAALRKQDKLFYKPLKGVTR